MKSTTATYKNIIASGETRNWRVTINMTLANNTTLTLTEDDIMQGSFKIMSASSSESSFDIGSAIIGKCQFNLNNWNDRFTNYDFFNATAVVWVQLVGDSIYQRVGFYTVDEPIYAGSLVQIEMLDNMWKFDVPLPSGLPTNARGVVNAICSRCGVILATQDFHGYQLTVRVPDDMEMNCRELLQYVAMMGCNFCIINSQGNLELKWYDKGDFEQDGSFVGNEDVNYFTRLTTRNIGTDVITITGVKFTINNESYLIGREGYVLSLENPLVNEENVSIVSNCIWDVLEGLKIRTFNISALSDIAPEVGDSVAISYKGTMIYSYLTNYTFTPGLCGASLGAVTPNRSLTTRYNADVIAAVEIARKNTDKQISNFDLAVQMINSLAINAMGGFMEFEDLPTGGRIWYISNMPITKNVQGQCEFEPDSIVFKMAGNGFFVSTNGGQTFVNGYDPVTGQLVVNVLNAIGINAEWIHTGELTVGGTGTGTSNPYITVKDTSNNTICTINSNGIIMYKGLIQSPDYQEETPVGTYSRLGMSINVNSSIIKSPYFALNRLGAFLKGTIEATGGKIGGVQITANGLFVMGDRQILSITEDGSYDFTPDDYAFHATSARLKFKTGGIAYPLITINIYDARTLPYTLLETVTMDDAEKESVYIIGIHSQSRTFKYSFEVSNVYSGYLDIYVEDSILARIDQDGFHGVLDGSFKGYLESKSGKIAGIPYSSGAFKGDVNIENSDGYGGNNARISINPGDTNDKPDIVRVFWENGNTKTEHIMWGSGGSYQNLITQGLFPPSGSATEGDLKFVGSDGTNSKELYRFEGTGGGQGSWVKVNLNITTSDTDSIQPGVSALATGSLFLVYE